jgi:tetratricopeptide (TPR) repeat protein
MSAWAQLYSLASSWIKRPAVWLGGLLTAAVAAFVTTNLLTPVQTFLAEKTAEKACQYRQKPIANESQFTILISPLAHDPDRSHTERGMRAFLGEIGFLVVPICESLNFDFSTDLQTAMDEALQRARELIKTKHADLLLFGDVRERDKAVMIYAMNEHGGCELRPKPTIIQHGDLPDDFNAEEKENLIAVSLQEIQSACLNQSSVDWPLFAIRMTKMEHFLATFPSSHAKYIYLARAYVEATRLLYSNGQGESWFANGENFAKQIIGEFQGNKADLSPIWAEYGILQFLRFKKTGDKNDQETAFDAYDKAIGLDPKYAWAYSRRGLAYADKSDFDRAIEDYTKSIGLNPKDAVAYHNRGVAYWNKDQLDRAIEDYSKSIGLDPKDAVAYHDRCVAYLDKGEWDRAIEDCDKAIGLDPKDAVAYRIRGFSYSNKGEWDRAIEDYTKSIGLDPKFALAYRVRCEAYKAKGDMDRANVDFQKSAELKPN